MARDLAWTPERRVADALALGEEAIEAHMRAVAAASGVIVVSPDG